MNADEFADYILSGKYAEIDTEKNTENITKVRRLSDRQFMLIGYRTRTVNNRHYVRKFITVENVSMNMRKKEIAKIRRMGCFRVDCIETYTIANEKVGKTVNSRQMEFAKQIFAAANDKLIPPPVVQEKMSASQTTIAWEILSVGEDAFLYNRPIVKVADRKAAAKAQQKRNEMYNKMNAQENQIDAMKIFHKASGMFMFSSTEESEIVNFIQDNNLNLEDIVLYVSNEIYHILRSLEN